MDAKFFKIAYKQDGADREKYVLMEKEPEKHSMLESMLCVEPFHPNMDGGIYGSTRHPYGMFVPEECEIEAVSSEEFADKLMETLSRSYLRKYQLSSMLNNLL